jgi:hypothetical protein
VSPSSRGLELRTGVLTWLYRETWALNSAVECHLHTVEVIGSNPIAPTIFSITYRDSRSACAPLANSRSATRVLASLTEHRRLFRTAKVIPIVECRISSF